MKYYFLSLIVAASFLISCKKENLLPTTTINDMTDTTAILKYSGIFMRGPYGTVNGSAEIYQKGLVYELKLANFTTTNGPALHVYIAKEAMPVNFIDLGALKSTNGNQVYSITGMPDFMDFKYISIHCVAYNHLFGSALLQ